jgi:hypothetical protein
MIKGAALTVVLSLALVSGAFALARKDKSDETLAKYEKTGETISCINTRTARDIDVLDDYSLLVRANGEYYLNEFGNRCSGLARERRYVHESTQNQMCRGDIIRVINSMGHPFGSCSLGDFEKLVEIETDE